MTAMLRSAVIAAMLFGAGPLVAHAQTAGQGGGGTAQGPLPMREPNLANPQAQDNAAMQPPNARTDPAGGQASSIPTPVLNDRPMTSTSPPSGASPRPTGR